MGIRELSRDRLDNLLGPVNLALVVSPTRSVQFLSGVVVTVLRSRGTVEINHQLEAGFPGPTDSPVQVLLLATNVRPCVVDKGPVTNGQTNVVQAGVTDLEKVITGDKVFPVVTKRAFGSTAVLLLAKGVLVDNGVLERLKQAWGDPRFKYQPTSQIDTSNFFLPIGETDIDTTVSRSEVDGWGSAH